MRRLTVASVCLIFACFPAQAFETRDGDFVANKACEAWQSKNKRTNPGNVVTEPGRAYEVKGVNAPGGDYFQIVLPDAPGATDRWVRADCGTFVDKGKPQKAASRDAPSEHGEAGGDFVLALNWQPSFCQVRPAKSECKKLNRGLLPETETQLSIHGLWPQPIHEEYCGVSRRLVEHDRAGRWWLLPELDLDGETRKALDFTMPGTASYLDRHEWYKHGTCHPGDVDANGYYKDTLRLHAAINDTPISGFLADNIGRRVSTADIRDLFDEAFGKGAGARVRFRCTDHNGRILLNEVLISLRGVLDDSVPVQNLLLAADPVAIGCREGVIDPAGLQ
ncbi:ribonuclease T [Hoeflea sp. WL0058]|uniref:Ribonuclease T n=1 Tax=Flavimaribacter sediminis TaxID=2865987 RepID=A0AAE3D3U6_9HYPH|nr:ribonuclease T [Flavimaribacter sediminis]MBW8640206.1 ribonuclease T [Flavimaribacter sediminis]